jgi:hypothetical protein
MLPTCSITAHEGVTIIKMLSHATLAGVIQAINDLADSSFPTEKRLWDLTAGIALSSFNIKVLSIHALNKNPDGARVALVAPEDLALGLSSITEVNRIDGATKTRVFNNVDEAVSWLNYDE